MFPTPSLHQLFPLYLVSLFTLSPQSMTCPSFSSDPRSVSTYYLPSSHTLVLRKPYVLPHFPVITHSSKIFSSPHRTTKMALTRAPHDLTITKPNGYLPTFSYLCLFSVLDSVDPGLPCWMTSGHHTHRLGSDWAPPGAMHCVSSAWTSIRPKNFYLVFSETCRPRFLHTSLTFLSLCPESSSSAHTWSLVWPWAPSSAFSFILDNPLGKMSSAPFRSLLIEPAQSVPPTRTSLVNSNHHSELSHLLNPISADVNFPHFHNNQNGTFLSLLNLPLLQINLSKPAAPPSTWSPKSETLFSHWWVETQGLLSDPPEAKHRATPYSVYDFGNVT